MAEAETLRIDKFLWFARIAKTRSQAQELAEQGRLRLGGRAPEELDQQRAGDVEPLGHRRVHRSGCVRDDDA